MNLFRTKGDMAHQATPSRAYEYPARSSPQRKNYFVPSSNSHLRRNSRSACTTSSTVLTLSSPNSSFEDPSSPEKRDAHLVYYDVQDDDGENCQAGYGCLGEWIINKFSPPSRKDAFSPAVAHSPDSRYQRRINGIRHSVITPTKLELTSTSCENDLTDGCSCSSTSESSLDSPYIVHKETTNPIMQLLENILSMASKAEDDCNINAAIGHLENYLYQLHHHPNLSLTSKRAAVLHKLGCLQWQCGRYRLSLCALVEACAAFDSLIKDSGSDVQPTLKLASADVLVSMGRLHLSKGEGAAAMHCYRECVHRLSSVQNQCDRAVSTRIFAQACNGAGRVLLAQGKPSPALKRFKRALKVQLGYNVEDIAAVSFNTARVPLQEIAETLSNLGRLYEEQNDLEMAMVCYFKSSRIISTALGPNHVDAGEVSNRLGRILHKLGRFSEADQAIRRAHQIFMNNLGEHHRNTAAAMLSLGMLYASQGKHKRAQTIYHQVLKVQHATFNGEVHADLALVFHCIATSYEGSFKLEKAIHYYNEELFVLKTCLHPYHLDIAKLLHHMAMVTMNIVDNDGNYLMLQESIEWLEEAAGIYQHHNQSNAFHKEMQYLNSSIQKLRSRQIS
ncbi:hypothetical protein ACHAWO_007622 [Cyclotella atomus]|uniref:Kinesin light chain n=1 Tax=Cyclotella atomus TaxID=382360 RepID=A0ABD3NGH5_9STRA